MNVHIVGDWVNDVIDVGCPSLGLFVNNDGDEDDNVALVLAVVSAIDDKVIADGAVEVNSAVIILEFMFGLEGSGFCERHELSDCSFISSL